MNIGERIKQKRIEKGWSQRELCKRMGYSNHSTIGKIETGKVDIPQSRIVQFSEVLGVSVAFLMGWQEEMKKSPAELAERHFEILINEDIADIFEEFNSLDKKQKQIVKDLIHSLAETKKADV